MSATDTPKTILKSSYAFLSGTFLSRLSGLGRDTTMAAVFGSHPAIAAFMVAFRFANLIRRLFGEGPLPAGFIPHFESVRGASEQQGAQFFRDLFFSLACFLTLFIGGVEVVLLSIWHFAHLSEGSAQILFLTILMLPGVLFICLFGLCGGLLQCNRRFFITGFAPVAFNLVWIGAVLLLRYQEPVLATVDLSLAVVLAFLMQWAMIAPQTFAYMRQTLSWKECFRPRLFSSELVRLVKPFLLGVIGVGAVQINSAMDAIFARCSSLEGPAYLWYAIRIQQLPLALFGIALSSALLPPLARAIKEGAFAHYMTLLRFALRRSFSLIFPCSAGLFVLGVTGTNLLYGRGDFDVEATYQTVLCLWGYGLGLLPAVFVLILAPAFYADRDYRTPTKGSLLSVALNLCLSALFVFAFHWGAFSIAVATSLSAWFNYLYLSVQLSRKLGETPMDKEVVVSYLKTATATIVATIATLLIGLFFVADPTLSLLMGNSEVVFERAFATQALQFVAMGGVFLLTFVSYAWMLNAEDVLCWVNPSK